MPTPGKRPSMRQIAVAAGVSVATVSHVINGSGRFSEDTRKRVEAPSRNTATSRTWRRRASVWPSPGPSA